MQIHEKNKIISSIKDENQLRVELVIPLLRKVGFENVYDNQGNNECGNDVIIEKKNTLGRTEYIGIILKHGNITKQVNKQNHLIRTIDTQVKEAYQSEITHPKVPKNTYISSAWIMTNGTISNSAESYFENNFKQSQTQYRGLECVASNKLIELIDKYWPEFYDDNRPFLSQYHSTLKKIYKHNHFASVSLGKQIDSEELFIEPLARRAREFNNTDDGLRSNEKPVEFKTFLNPNSAFTLVLGEGGSGKSTFLQNIAIQKSKDKSVAPIIIPAKDFCKDGIVLEELIANTLGSIETYNHDIYEQEIKDCDKLLLIDALDEIETPQKKQEALKNIKNILENDKTTKAILTSRHETNSHVIKELQGFKAYRLLPMQYNQVKVFFNKWFKSTTMSNKLMEAINSKSVLDKLPKTPMVLTLLAAVYGAKGDLPTTLTELYLMFTDLMIGKWDQHKDIKSLEDAVICKSFLTKLAYKLHTENKDEISYPALSYFTQEYLNELGNTQKSPEHFISNLINRTCLLKKDKDDNVTFQHLSFQEYFTAASVFKRGTIESSIEEWLVDDWWSSVLFFIAGMKEDIGSLIPVALDRLNSSTGEELFVSMFTLGSMLQSGFETNYKIKVDTIKSAVSLMPRLYDVLELELGQKYQVSKFMVTLALLDNFSSNFSSNYLSGPLKDVLSELDIEVDQLSAVFIAGALSRCNGIEAVEDIGTSPSLKDPILITACDFLIDIYNQRHEITTKNIAQKKLEKRVKKYIKLIKKDINRMLKPK